MKATQALTAALKAELRRAGITYAQLARELGLAESSVKRMFAKADMPLSRIDEVLRVLDALQTDELCACNRPVGGETLAA